MPAKHKRIVIYPDDTAAAEWAILRAYYERKAGPDITVNDGYIGRELIHQKAVDIRNKETKSLTIQQIYDLVQLLRVEVKAALERGPDVQQSGNSHTGG